MTLFGGGTVKKSTVCLTLPLKNVFSFAGMMYNEITASSLVKVNMQGEVVEEGTTNFGVNQVQLIILNT